MGYERAWHSPAWLKECNHVTLQKLYRCKDKAYAEILNTLRLHRPKKALINRLCLYQKAWNTKEPSVDDIKKLFHEKPETMILTFSKRGERLAKECARQAVFGNRKPLATLPGDVEQNPDNYDERGVHEAGRGGFTVKPTEQYPDECLDIVHLRNAKAVMTPLTELKSTNLNDETTVCDQDQHTSFRVLLGSRST